ncbi:hypothetical protein BU25DRAFT_428844 [Macroventuria anomochaeta]|uniref:Uncharacterized protein n=1 Tax=Macroventuria anomochaeta TaxID=301207 RepID=A0ACB6SA01_9PLEO|nr:uncharacterized protein BU25DRAFT_428844 [Macroventuria anomochaeta]KAF2631100.1 hypothetical protein BU25DRAFT_428844 [Macroventuria anomochaeta]
MLTQKIVVTRNLLDGCLQPCDRLWLLVNVKGAAGLLVMVSDKTDKELLEAAGSQLKAVATFTAGTDHIDLAALKKRNIRLGYITDYLSDAVADLTVMLGSQMPWHPLLMAGPQIRGVTVGFLGFGRIAQAALKRLIATDKRVIYVTSKPGKPVWEDYYDLIKHMHGLTVPVEVARNLGQLASESDVVIVGCALTPSTKHLVNADFFKKMKKTSVIVNIARGPVIDTNSLVDALDQGKIFGTGLDVIEDEPNIQAIYPILEQPRCVLLPHIGSATLETREQMVAESVQNLLAGSIGEAMVNELKL